MAREKMTVTIEPETRALVDADAQADGLSRSEYVARVLRHEHYRRLLARVERPDWAQDEERLARDVLKWQHESAS